MVFLEGSATDKMLHVLADYVQTPAVEISLEKCFEAALQKAGHLSTCTILFSPGAKSFEKFDNEFDRGRTFNAIVDKKLRTG